MDTRTKRMRPPADPWLRRAAARAQRWMEWAERHRSRLFIAMGALSGTFFAAYFARNAVDPFPALSPRVTSIEQAIAAMKAGAPPIFALDPGPTYPGFYKPDVDAGGMVFFYPLAGRVLGIDSASELLRLSYIAMAATTAAVVPWLYGTLFRSLTAGIAAPVLMFIALDRVTAIVPYDMYWIPGFLLVAGAPVLMLALTRWQWDRRTIGAIFGLLVVVSLGNSIRPQVGFPLLIGAIAVLVAREPRWKHRAIVGALFVVAYASISSGAMKLATEYRDWRVDGSEKFALRDYEQAGGAGDAAAWHQVYIGLSFIRNRHGINQYLDEEAQAYVERAVPGTRYLSQEYADILRDRVVEIAKDDPAFIAETLVAKVGVALSLTLERWRYVFPFVALMLLFGPLRRQARRWVALLALMAAIGLIPALISWPSDLYAVPFASAFVVAGLLAAAWVGQTVGAGGRWLVGDLVSNDWTTSGGKTGSDKALDRIRGGIDSRSLLKRGGVFAAMVAASVGVSAVLTFVSRGGRDTNYYYEAVNYNVPKLPSSGAVQASWSFPSSLPDSWTVVGDVATRDTRGGVRVEVGPNEGVVSPPVMLEPGLHVLSARGTIPDGGIFVQVVDANTGQVFAQQPYWSDETRSGPTELGVGVDMVDARPVRYAILYWGRRADDTSAVVLNSARVYRAAASETTQP